MPRTAKAPKDKLEAAIEVATVEEEQLPASSEVESDAKRPPQPTDPEWQDYVLSQFTQDEKDPEGNPTAEACRIVVERLLGTIISENVRTIQVPTEENDYRATVEVSVRIAWNNCNDDIREFEDVADVGPHNMDPKYARFPTASAKTKALGRAYKSALKLRRVYTSEELASREVSVPVEGFFERLATISQQNFIQKVCRDLEIDVAKFINSGQRKYNHISQVPLNKAEIMINKSLDKFQKDPSTIPVNIRVNGDAE